MAETPDRLRLQFYLERLESYLAVAADCREPTRQDEFLWQVRRCAEAVLLSLFALGGIPEPDRDQATLDAMQKKLEGQRRKGELSTVRFRPGFDVDSLIELLRKQTNLAVHARLYTDVKPGGPKAAGERIGEGEFTNAFKVCSDTLPLLVRWLLDEVQRITDVEIPATVLGYIEVIRTGNGQSRLAVIQARCAELEASEQRYKSELDRARRSIAELRAAAGADPRGGGRSPTRWIVAAVVGTLCGGLAGALLALLIVGPPGSPMPHTSTTARLGGGEPVEGGALLVGADPAAPLDAAPPAVAAPLPDVVSVHALRECPDGTERFAAAPLLRIRPPADRRQWPAIDAGMAPVPRDYCLARRLVTIGEFRRYVASAPAATRLEAILARARGCRRDPSDGAPIRCVTREEAAAYCQWLDRTDPAWRGAALPSIAHWEAAARSGRARVEVLARLPGDGDSIQQYEWVRDPFLPSFWGEAARTGGMMRRSGLVTPRQNEQPQHSWNRVSGQWLDTLGFRCVVEIE